MEKLFLLKPKKVDGVTVRPQMEDFALFNTSNARFFVVNPVGYTIFEECNGNNSINEIAETVYNKCATKPDISEIKNDVLEMIKALKENELVEVDI